MQAQQLGEAKVALVDMPWDLASRPNAALGLIKPLLERAGIPVDVLHANVILAERMTFEKYYSISHGPPWLLLPEWLFSKAAFPESFPEPTSEVIARWPEHNHSGMASVFGEDKFAEALTELREHAAFELCEQVAAHVAGRRLVAFTCSINQLVPAIAAARTIKRRAPSVKILLGGAQVEGEMGDEVLRVAPWIDAIYKGEAEVGLAFTVRWLLGELAAPPGDYVSWRDSQGRVHCAPGVAIVKDMREVPVPDFAPYFEQIAPYRTRRTNRLSFDGIPFVSSRGCWWGEKQHCTFCGLNGLGMVYRERDPDAVIEELLQASSKYQAVRMYAADNIIPHRYLRTFLPRLAEHDLDLEIFYETKSNLSRKDIELFRAAGVKSIQPGIESLNDHVLELMRKGVTGIHNAYLLKLCRELQLDVKWNLIYGFPGETEEDYAQQLHWMKRMHHFMPPSSTVRFCLQRFSPFHFESAKLGVKEVHAKRGYDLLYPAGKCDLDKIAFYFDFEYAEEYEVTDLTIYNYNRETRAWFQRWNASGAVPMLVYLVGTDFLEIRDTRAPSRRHLYRVTGMEKDVLLACEAPTSLKKLADAFPDEQALASAIEALDKLGLIVSDSRHVLSLVSRAPKVAPFYQRVIASGFEAEQSKRSHEASQAGAKAPAVVADRPAEPVLSAHASSA